MAQPAPWYNDSGIFEGMLAPRTPNWNVSAPYHHWLVRSQPPMTDEQMEHSDALFQARWLALLSVNDMIEGLVQAVTQLGEIDSTFFMFTSDQSTRTQSTPQLGSRDVSDRSCVVTVAFSSVSSECPRVNGTHTSTTSGFQWSLLGQGSKLAASSN